MPNKISPSGKSQPVNILSAFCQHSVSMMSALCQHSVSILQTNQLVCPRHACDVAVTFLVELIYFVFLIFFKAYKL